MSHFSRHLHGGGEHTPPPGLVAADNLDDHIDPSEFRKPAYSGSGEKFKKKLLRPESPTGQKPRAYSIDNQLSTSPRSPKRQNFALARSTTTPETSEPDLIKSVTIPVSLFQTPSVRPPLLRQKSRSHHDLLTLDELHEDNHNSNNHQQHPIQFDIFKPHKIMFYPDVQKYVTDSVTEKFSTTFTTMNDSPNTVPMVRRSSTAAGSFAQASSTTDLSTTDSQKSTMTVSQSTSGQTSTTFSQFTDTKKSSSSDTTVNQMHRPHSGGLLHSLLTSSFFSKPVKMSDFDVNALSPSSS